MKSDAARRAQRKYAAKLADKGDRPMTLILSKKSHDRLERLALSYGSKRAVIEALLSGD